MNAKHHEPFHGPLQTNQVLADSFSLTTISPKRAEYRRIEVSLAKETRVLLNNLARLGSNADSPADDAILRGGIGVHAITGHDFSRDREMNTAAKTTKLEFTVQTRMIQFPRSKIRVSTHLPKYLNAKNRSRILEKVGDVGRGRIERKSLVYASDAFELGRLLVNGSDKLAVAE
ncbi:MAG: hypothetical protein P8L85_19415 [Rubripirellula sp.]|nr:hypothetical protein [Rubripirellula sp.]